MVQRVLILVGPPGSGKSTFAKALTKVFPEYVRINQDDLGDRITCEEMTMSALQANNRTQSVIIDRCNFNQSQRKVWLEIAKQLNVSEVNVIIMDTQFYHCKQRILARADHPTQVEGFHGVDILYKFLEMMTLPTYFEGFSRILRLEPQLTPEYSDEAVKEIMERLQAVTKPENLQAPRWQKDDYYFKTQYHRDEEAYRARKTAQHQQRRGPRDNNHHQNRALEMDSEGFAIMKRSNQKEGSSPPAPVRPPLFGGASGGWRAREAAKLQQQQEPARFGPTIQEISKPAIANPFDLLGENNSDDDNK
ncbi:hypothetical protein BX616_007382 [Lobosporangium transversale]|uniref:AAA domain-domain-containing protein n=1 Tax=Lobosporangium transversale TaxID=64571 RepID=A0A1Y2H6U0_9FUNG|nr:AAA domain-domain-containing protein [Lobosporangium transversale]KAF9914881.1 hypothetical protein BX616_007382 [Lobosporangium transversale]ORZ28772.1 AAA domain-domain-containing protein [Lobosporangium transversale]|eukprot:XP_021886445.1 AAA domain-domain-containing protein [Lobosporangium transversale]